jgi:DDE superfamily endonuclease
METILVLTNIALHKQKCSRLLKCWNPSRPLLVSVHATMPSDNVFDAAQRQRHLLRSRASQRARSIIRHSPGGCAAVNPTRLSIVFRQIFKCVAQECVRISISEQSRDVYSLKGPVVRRQPLNFRRHLRLFGESDFKRLYRVSKSDFKTLVSLLEPDLRRSQRFNTIASSTDPSVMVAVALRFLAGAKALDLGWPYGLALSTVYAVIDETLDAINTSSRLDNIRFPVSSQDCREEATAFQTLRASPMYGFIAALDGIAIAIRCPAAAESADARKYFNRKGFYAISVQATVSASYKVTFLSAKHAGSTHDSTAFTSTALHDFLSMSERDGGLPSWAVIAADDAYGNGSAGGRIITPFSGRNLEQRNDSFNFYLSSIRITVDQVFGVIVSCWGILWSPLRCSLRRATRIVVVCAKLHNFIIEELYSRGATVDFNDIAGADTDNRVEGEPEVFLQDCLHVDGEVARHVRQGPGVLRDELATHLQTLGLRRPAH